MSVSRRVLTINGARRSVICSPEETLSSVLRRIGLTGVKVGCRAGQCGACTVILDDKPVRSCVRKMKSIEEFEEITTVEGIGTPNNLHPLQQAWITYGGIQCGFCTPGFIVSAKALLDKNIDPTREEVREWFQKNRNLCRCTGYKPLVDATLAAAKVMRGEAEMKDITWQAPDDGQYYGKNIPRRESGVSRATGTANYGEDLEEQMPRNTLHLAIVSPFVGHANIKGIDSTEALKMPGVVGVLTAEDVVGTNRYGAKNTNPRTTLAGSERPIICDKKIFKYGDIVAVVAANSREEAREAAKAVKVDLEELPFYGNQLESLLPNSIRIHDESENMFFRWPLKKGEDTRPIMDNDEKTVIEGSFFSGKQPHLPLEPDTAQAYIDDDGILVIHHKAQHIYGVPGTIGPAIGYPTDKIRVQMNECGGSFGSTIQPEVPALAAVAAIKYNRPASLTLSYEEQQLVTGKRHGANSNAKMAAGKDGKIEAFEYEMCYDAGAYTGGQQVLLWKCLALMGHPYNFPNIRGIAKSAVSNIGFGTAYRAYSGVQVATCQEAMMDMMAEKLNIDPLEFRYINAARPGDKCPTGTDYSIYPAAGMLDMLRPKYREALKRAEENSTPTKKRGVGIAMGGYTMGGYPDMAQVKLELNSKNKIVCYNTWEDMGQHAENGALLHMLEAFRPLNLTEDRVELVMGDNFTAPDAGPAAGSRCHYFVGNAIIDGAEKLMAMMKKPDGSYRSYDEMVADELETSVVGSWAVPEGLAEVLDYNDGNGTSVHEMMYNLNMAEIEVDVDTGETKVLKFTTMADIGAIGNPQGVEGQAYGGIEHGIGFALKEEFTDMSKHATLVGAGFLEIEEMPDDIELLWHNTPRDLGPYGSSGCSENFQQSIHMAVINAINNAVGVRIYETPAKPEKIKAALDAKAKGETLKQDKYYLGLDLFDELDYCEENPV